jgi:hypothetical protein
MFNLAKKSVMKNYSTPLLRKYIGFTDQRKILNSEIGKSLRSIYKYDHQVINTKNVYKTSDFILKYGSKLSK